MQIVRLTALREIFSTKTFLQDISALHANASGAVLTVAGGLQGCMKSGQVLTDRRYKWFEPEYWRFGDPASAEGQINYMRHASGQVPFIALQSHSMLQSGACYSSYM